MSETDRPILPAWAVREEGGRISFIHLEKGPAEAIAAQTSTHPNRRLVKIWIREQATARHHWRSARRRPTRLRGLGAITPQTARALRRPSFELRSSEIVKMSMPD